MGVGLGGRALGSVEGTPLGVGSGDGDLGSGLAGHWCIRGVPGGHPVTNDTNDDLIDQYKKLDQDVIKLEGALEAAREQRGKAAEKLLIRDGKGHGYDMGDGVEQIVCRTKVGTHYLVARSRWVKQGVAKEARAPKEPKAPKPAKAPKPKRAIVNGQIVEIQAEPARAPKPKAKPKKAVPEAAVAAVAQAPEAPEAAVAQAPEPPEREAVGTSVAHAAQAPVAEAEPPKAEASPAVTPSEPIDPLDAALAALDL